MIRVLIALFAVAVAATTVVAQQQQAAEQQDALMKSLAKSQYGVLARIARG